MITSPEKSPRVTAQQSSRSRLLWFRVVAMVGVITLASSTFLCPSLLSSQEPEKTYTRAQFYEAMEEVQQFKFDQLPPDQQQDDESWLNDIDHASHMLNEMARAYDTPREELREMLFEMVEGMGKDDSADLRLHISQGGSLTPTSFWTDFGGVEKQLFDRHVYLHSSMAEAQVRDWCQNPEKVERAVWFQSWVGQFPHQRGGTNFMVVAQRFDDQFKPNLKTGPGADYWVYARLFVFSACVTNRRDLYAGLDPTQLQPRYIEWRDWMHSTFPLEQRWRASGYSPSYIFDPEGVAVSKQDSQRVGFPKLIVVPKTPYPTWGNIPAMAPEKVAACW